MKKNATALAALVLALLTLTSCGKKLVIESGMYYDKSNKVYYHEAPSNYDVVSYSTEEYAALKNGISSSFRTIRGLDPLKWLYDPVGGVLLYSSDTVLPTLEKMNPNQFIVCTDGEVVSEMAGSTEKAVVDELVALYRSGAKLKRAPSADADNVYRIRFTSEEYSSLYYCIKYHEYAADVCEYEDTDDIESYTYRSLPDSVKVTTTEKADGGWEICYNYGKYILFDRETGEYRAAGDIIEKLFTVTEE